MSRLRAILVACLTLAVAALPAAGASASMMASGDAGTAMHADSAKHAAAAQPGHQAHDDHGAGDVAKGHCAYHAACGGKCLCLGLTAVLAGGSWTPAKRLPRPAATSVAASLNGPAYIPPSPPPRL